jgi:murein tripeptide amidase MpaA
VRVRFDRFYTYAALQELLEAWAAEFPSLLRLESIGQSYEGREISLATVTNLETGPPEEKPAVFVHAQIHAMEFTGTTAALTLLDRLLHEHGSDERITHAHVLRRPAREPGRRRSRPRGRALAPVQRTPVPAR